ncbi:MAG: hypothetical protein CVT79_03950 [Alphaproteobacteria bacterium HGW-Alphaproteobacteria-18]|nr:MAG: hypothetical protein CVT79_03950 [Alphaproteobacteria bacterium HGW-Alphaproteobacteria-18]
MFPADIGARAQRSGLTWRRRRAVRRYLRFSLRPARGGFGYAILNGVAGLGRPGLAGILGGAQLTLGRS